MALYKEYDSAVKKSRRSRAIKKLASIGAALALVCLAAGTFVVNSKGEQPAGYFAIVGGANKNIATPVQGILNQQAGSDLVTADANLNQDGEAEVEDAVVVLRKNQSRGWEFIGTDEIKSTFVAANEYQKSSNGLYLPKIHLTCEKLSYGASFIVDEILSTEVASIKISSNLAAETEQKWKLSETYRAAYAPNPDMFINLLRAASTLTVTYQTFGDDQDKTSEFDLTGSSKAINEFRSQCAMDSSSGIVGTSLEY